MNKLRAYEALDFRFGSKLDGDGDYWVIVRNGAFKLPEEYKEDWECDIPVFSFNPAKIPPVIEETCVWWRLVNKKIKVVLPHGNASNGLARYYGFIEVRDRFLEQKKENEDAGWERLKKYSAEAAERRIQEAAELKKKLLS